MNISILKAFRENTLTEKMLIEEATCTSTLGEEGSPVTLATEPIGSAPGPGA